MDSDSEAGQPGTVVDDGVIELFNDPRTERALAYLERVFSATQSDYHVSPVTAVKVAAAIGVVAYQAVRERSMAMLFSGAPVAEEAPHAEH